MKRLLYIIIGLVFSLQMQAQTFPHSGMETWYSVFKNTMSFPQEEKGYTHAWHNGDTVINGVTWTHIRIEDVIKAKFTTGPNPGDTYEQLYPTQYRDAFYINSGDTVYYLNPETGNKSFYWYNNPQPGDIWKYELMNPETHTLDTAYIMVSSVSLYSINGYPSKNIAIETCGSCNPVPYGFFIDDVIINTVMGPNQSQLIFNYQPPNTIVEFPLIYEDIICFQSNEVPFFHKSTNFSDCYAYITLSNEEENNTPDIISIYPNPTSSFLHIYNEGNKNIFGQIIDLSGKVVKNDIQLAPQTTTIVPLAHLSRGVYILKLVNDAGEMQTHKIIKN